MDSSMQNMLDMYLFETNGLIEQLDALLLESEQADSFSEEDINTIFRIMHTIKGSSAMMQFESLQVAAHRIEDLFFIIRENGMNHEHSRDLFNMLFTASDFMKSEIEKIENGEELTQDISEITGQIQRVVDLISGNPTADDSAAEAAGADASAGNSFEGKLDAKHPYGIKVFFDEGLGMENLRAFMIVTSMNEVSEDFVFYPQDIETNNAAAAYIIDEGFLMGFVSPEEQKTAQDVVASAVNVRTFETFTAEFTAEPAPAPAEEAPAPAAEAAPAPAAAPAAPAPAAKADDKKPAAKKEQGSGSKQSLISVNLSRLDNLMDIVGEIVIAESMVTSCPDLADFQSDNFSKAARQLRKLTDELQDTAMSIRMVPVSSTFQKMTRIVRDMSQKLNKKARLVTIGADTEVDKTIVDSIGDPIMHMVRNAMDHGIEANVQDRIARGKPEEGTVTLSAEHKGSEVVITISDDGGGVSTEAVLAKAKKNGLLTKPESEYTRREVLNMLLLPGFSTNTEVTEYSGRGVGMDVVKKNIEKVGGSVTITSEEGEGMTTTFKIPLTLAIVDGMQLSVGDLVFTVPIANIRQSFKIKKAEMVYDEAGREMVQREDNFLPVVRLSEFYDIESDIKEVEDGIMMWVESGGEKSFCMFVDKLIGEQQVVVKALPVYLKPFDIKSSGISGCSIMGDGDITIILDPLNLHDAAINSAY